LLAVSLDLDEIRPAISSKVRLGDVLGSDLDGRAVLSQMELENVDRRQSVYRPRR
jgi:hypothetical protein